jgi:hypothetical protein
MWICVSLKEKFPIFNWHFIEIHADSGECSRKETNEKQALKIFVNRFLFNFETAKQTQTHFIFDVNEKHIKIKSQSMKINLMNFWEKCEHFYNSWITFSKPVASNSTEVSTIF